MPSDCPTCSALADRVLKLEAQVGWMQQKQSTSTTRTAVQCLTAKDVQLLRLTLAWWREHRGAPTGAELAKLMGVSHGSIDTRLRKLRQLGAIAKNPKRRAGAIRVLYDPDAQGVA